MLGSVVEKTKLSLTAGLAIMLWVIVFCSPAGAVLPPGAHEAMAADAPVVVIAKVVKVRDLGGMRLADCRILARMRGKPQEGSTIEIRVPEPPKRRLMGPNVAYHHPKEGQHWLLLLNNPNPRVAEAAPIRAKAYSFASHGWYTRRLDSLSGSADLLAKAPKATDQEMAEDVAEIQAIYRWAGAWMDQHLR